MNIDTELKIKIAEMEELQRQLAVITAEESERMIAIQEKKAECANLWGSSQYNRAARELTNLNSDCQPLRTSKTKIQVKIATCKAEIAREKRIVQRDREENNEHERQDLWFLETLCLIVRRACDTDSIGLSEEETKAFSAAKKRLNKAVFQPIPPKSADTVRVINSFKGKVL